MSRLRNPGRIATCHVGPPPRIACARLGSRRRRRPRVLQLHRVPSTAPDLGLLHGVHLTPWWTPSSTSRPLNSRRVRRTLTPKTQTSQSTKVTSTCREVRSFVISLDDRTTLLTRSCKVQCEISSPRIVGCAVHASHSDVLEDGIHDVRTVAGTAHPPVNRLFHAALSCCEILPPPTQVVAGCDHPLTRVATDRYLCGIVHDGARTTIVTGGLGTSGVPLRFGAPPDLWLISLGPKASSARVELASKPASGPRY